MKLDLSVKGRLSVEDSLLIDKISPKVQSQYNKFVKQVINDNALHELDFLLQVVSRNPLQSLILPTFCKVSLLQEKLKQGDVISAIIVENSLMLTTVNGVLSQFNQKITVKVSQKKLYMRTALFVLLRFIQSIYMIMISWLWPRLSGVYKKQPKDSILLVDNFVLPNSFTKEGIFFDRYYSDYSQYLNESQKNKIWYSPTLVGFKSLFKCLEMSNKSKKSQHNFLFQESWVTLGDYIHAMYLTIVLPFKIKKVPLFMGYDVRRFLISEARKDIFSPSLIKTICKFKFIKNLKSGGVEICQAVDWHENQNIDKALNLGFNKYYSSVIVKGYQGYIAPSYWAHTVPQSFELENALLPDQLHVISENRKKTILDSCPNLDVRVASAFRFSYLYDTKRIVSHSETPIILIALPIDIVESESILNACVNLHSLVGTEVNIMVKQHPAYERDNFAKLVPIFFNHAFTPTDDSMSALLGRISLLISSSSSTCAEAASLGIPVAIYGSRYGVTMNTIGDINNTEDNVFYSEEQLVAFIDYYLKNDNQEKDIERYFFVDNGESAQALFVCE